MSRRPSVTPCTDRRTHASRRGLCEGGVALRGCALLLFFPFFPPSRPSSPPVLRPARRSHTGSRYFSFLSCDTSSHLFHCPIIFLLHFLSSCSLSFIMVFVLQTCLLSSVATPHSARRHFGSMDITGETFLELRGTPRLPADHLLSFASFISFSPSLSPSSSPSLLQDSRL